MTEILDTISAVTGLLRTLVSIDRALLNDEELCELATAEETARRLLDGAQVQTAAEIDERSRFELGSDGLSMQNGIRKPVPFLEYLTRASQRELARRVKLGHAIRPRVALTGDVLPPAFPFLAAGIRSGVVSTDAAATVIAMLTQAERGLDATPELVDAAEQALSETAARSCTDVVATAARAWREALDPDGAEPRYDDILARSGMTRGGEHNGITDFPIKADPRTTALLNAVMDDATTPGALPRFLSDEDRERGTSIIIGADGQEVLAFEDPRSRQKKQLDMVVGVLTAGLRASHEAAPDLRATGAVIATVTLAELESGVGVGWLNGVEEPIPASVVQQLVCDAGVRVQILGNGSIPLFEATLGRYFTQSQKRAMMARDGDRCCGPGCQNPVAWFDAHHVAFYSKGGRTCADNGCMLCDACHAALHAGTFDVRMIDGVPHYRLGIHRGDETAWRRAGRAHTLGTAA